jgi:hypothetical protein
MIRRRRECLACSHRYTTYEQVEYELLASTGGEIHQIIRICPNFLRLRKLHKLSVQ